MLSRRFGCSSQRPGHLRRSALQSAAAGARYLNLGFLDENGLVAHFLTVEDMNRFVRLGIVLKLDVAECRRYSGYEIADDADRSRFEPTRLHPFLQLTVRAVVRNIDEEQLGHLTCL